MNTPAAITLPRATVEFLWRCAMADKQRLQNLQQVLTEGSEPYTEGADDIAERLRQLDAVLIELDGALWPR